jgi:hypothetical protein
MTVQTATADPDAPEPSAGPLVGAYRPERPDQGPGRWLRRFAGVKEDVLDWVPEERARYTRLGAIIVNTGVLAALSMLTTLGKFISVWWGFLLPIALLWGWVIVCIDSWLISSTHGVSVPRWSFRVRLMLSVLIGLVIAEPLMLKVFEPAIHRQVAQDRVEERAARETGLKNCNPVPFQPLDRVALDRCRSRGLLITVTDSPASIQAELRNLTAVQASRQRALDADKTKLASLEKTAREECNGKKGSGFSGVVGQGPNCRRDREQADQFRSDSGIAQREAELTAFQTQINTKHAELSRSDTAYATEVDRAIKAQLPPTTGKIGLLEEEKALERLTVSNLFVFLAQLLVRALLVAVDVLPILTKKLSGTTTYDRLISRQLVTDNDLHEFDDKLRKKRDLAPKQTELMELEYAERHRTQAEAARDEAERLQQKEDVNRKIDAMAARLRGE